MIQSWLNLQISAHPWNFDSPNLQIWWMNLPQLSSSEPSPQSSSPLHTLLIPTQFSLLHVYWPGPHNSASVNVYLLCITPTHLEMYTIVYYTNPHRKCTSLCITTMTQKKYKIVYYTHTNTHSILLFSFFIISFFYYVKHLWSLDEPLYKFNSIIIITHI